MPCFMLYVTSLGYAKNFPSILDSEGQIEEHTQSCVLWFGSYIPMRSSEMLWY